MSQEIFGIEKFIGVIWVFIPIIALALILMFISQVIGWFIKDRVIKLFDSHWVAVLIKDTDKNGLNEAYFGRLNVPSQAGGGFEIFFDLKGIENPERLLAYMVRTYRETGNIKYLNMAQKLFNSFKGKGLLPGRNSLSEVVENPFSQPSQASKKIRSEEIKDIFAIIRFIDTLSEDEIRKRNNDLQKAFHPSVLKIFQRKIYNALGYVKDKLTKTISLATSTASGYLPIDLRKKLEEYEKEAVSKLGAHYDPLLENSIGRLVIVQVEDADGSTKLYQGVLREYSPNYLAIYNVDYRVLETVVFKGKKLVEGYPVEKLDFHGWHLNESTHLSIDSFSMESKKLKIKIRNVAEAPVNIISIKVNGLEEKLGGKVLFKNEEIETVLNMEKEVSSGSIIEIEYETVKKADIIWPRSKAKVIGLGEPVETFLDKIPLPSLN